MPEKREEETEAKNAEQQAKAETTETSETGADVDLDLEGLDLTVETVEERISPSETNVFDK